METPNLPAIRALRPTDLHKHCSDRRLRAQCWHWKALAMPRVGQGTASVVGTLDRELVDIDQCRAASRMATIGKCMIY